MESPNILADYHTDTNKKCWGLVQLLVISLECLDITLNAIYIKFYFVWRAQYLLVEPSFKGVAPIEWIGCVSVDAALASKILHKKLQPRLWRRLLGLPKDFSRKTASSDWCGTAVLKLLGLDLSHRTGCISLKQIYANRLLMTGTGSNYIK